MKLEQVYSHSNRGCSYQDFEIRRNWFVLYVLLKQVTKIGFSHLSEKVKEHCASVVLFHADSCDPECCLGVLEKER